MSFASLEIMSDTEVGADVMSWINRSPCKPGDAGSTYGFTSLSDGTLS